VGQQIHNEDDRREHLHQKIDYIAICQGQLLRIQYCPGLGYDFAAEQHDNGQNTGCDTYSQIDSHS